MSHLHGNWVRVSCLALGLIGLSVPAHAVTIDFEDLTGPDLFAGVIPFQPQHLDHYDNVGGTGVDVVFDGGVILDEAFELFANETSIYGTAFLGESAGPVLPNLLTISFSEPVTNLQFDVYNGWNQPVTYRVADNVGHSTEFTLPESALKGQIEVAFPTSGAIVTIQALTLGNFGEYDFFIDNITFNEPLNPVPEPASLLLLGSGLASAAVARRRRRRTMNE